MSIVQTNRDNDVSKPDVSGFRELFVNPELLQFHLAAFLLLVFPLSSFIGFVLDSRTCTCVLKLYLSTHGPSFAKIITQIYNSMGNVELAMTWVIFIISW